MSLAEDRIQQLTKLLEEAYTLKAAIERHLLYEGDPIRKQNYQNQLNEYDGKINTWNTELKNLQKTPKQSADALVSIQSFAQGQTELSKLKILLKQVAPVQHHFSIRNWQVIILAVLFIGTITLLVLNLINKNSSTPTSTPLAAISATSTTNAPTTVTSTATSTLDFIATVGVTSTTNALNLNFTASAGTAQARDNTLSARETALSKPTNTPLNTPIPPTNTPVPTLPPTATPSKPPQLGLPFEDALANNAKNDWITIGDGIWGFSDKGYTMINGNTGFSYIKGDSWSNYNVEVDIANLQGPGGCLTGEIWVRTRYLDEGNYLEVYITNEEIQITSLRNGIRTILQNKKVYFDIAGCGVDGGKYNFNVHEGAIEVYRNGNLIGQGGATENSKDKIMPSKGGVGFKVVKANWGSAAIKNVKIIPF